MKDEIKVMSAMVAACLSDGYWKTVVPESVLM
jgi:hypothetical protein